MIEWTRGFGRCGSACGRFTLHHYAYGLWSLYDYGGEDWPDRATLPDGRMTPSVSSFRSLKDAKHEAERRVKND